MQEVAHKIHIKKNGTQYDVNLYDNKFPSPDVFFPVKVGGTTYYLPATSYLSGDAAGGSTPLRIKKNGTTYQIIKKAECVINIPTYDNQKIVVEVTNSITGNKATYEKTVVVPFGSTFTARVQSTNSQYNAGSMTSVSSGTITEKNINLTASPATLAIPTGSTNVNVHSTTNLTVPSGITVLLIKPIENGKPLDDKKVYVGVTPGKTYRLSIFIKPPNQPPVPFPISSLESEDINGNFTIWLRIDYVIAENFTISWSPEINKQTPNVKDY